MSETVLPKDDSEPVLVNSAPTPDPIGPKRSGGRNNGLVILALLFGVAGIGVAGWGVWQLRAVQASHQVQRTQMLDLAAQTQTLQQHEQQLSTQLAQLPAAGELEERRRLVSQLQGDQQRLSQRLETVLGASRKDWRLAEAEHLLRLASLRLSALQDINSAQALVQGADEILREQDDPGAFAARDQLAKSLAALRSIDQPDRTGLFLQLAALRDQATQLNELAPEYKDKGESLLGLTTGDNQDSRWAQWWDQISHYIRIDFNADKNVRPLLAGQSLTQVRLALSLAIEQAQWAALNGEPQVYTRAMVEARDVLLSNFNQDNAQVKSLGEQLEALRGQPVAVKTPDLAQSLSAVQAYLGRRNMATDTPADSSSQPAQTKQGISP
ncbi:MULTISPECIES: uroporphyrinogen-III C-methyltransferase [Pseudomonas]|uniref:Uroporphyrin-III methyltransferase n=1 Tax=Pseudomonas syringae TaxID=317 RepID=A0A085VE64_PSESX|nr:MULTISPECIES: uroporphyrinogen-III C-methyltransferase [Pseudomonas]EPJ81868.1 putative uroporphyrin-III C-methyltransferase [Pseudomonas sp. CFII64]KFE53727.1 uroporphyrin-III methyltransferase [Pseudomonas syringae]